MVSGATSGIGQAAAVAVARPGADRITMASTNGHGLVAGRRILGGVTDGATSDAA